MDTHVFLLFIATAITTGACLYINQNIDTPLIETIALTLAGAGLISMAAMVALNTHQSGIFAF